MRPPLLGGQQPTSYCWACWACCPGSQRPSPGPGQPPRSQGASSAGSQAAYCFPHQPRHLTGWPTRPQHAASISLGAARGSPAGTSPVHFCHPDLKLCAFSLQETDLAFPLLQIRPSASCGPHVSYFHANRTQKRVPAWRGQVTGGKWESFVALCVAKTGGRQGTKVLPRILHFRPLPGGALALISALRRLHQCRRRHPAPRQVPR